MSILPSASLSPHEISAQEALDQFALQRLLLCYCHGVDRQDLALVRSLYHDDAIDDHGPMFCGSADEYVAWLPSMLSSWSLTAHIIHSSLFVIDDNTAEGESAMTAYHRTADGAREIIAHGRYLDQCKSGVACGGSIAVRSCSIGWRSVTCRLQGSPMAWRWGSPQRKIRAISG
jgi:hypothetical protein